MVPIEKDNLPADTVKLNVIKTIVEICEIKNIRLYFVQPPLFAKIEQTNAIKQLEQTVRKNDAEYLNYSNNPKFIKNVSLFQDYSHINNEEATSFSGRLASSIKKQNSKKNTITEISKFNLS